MLNLDLCKLYGVVTASGKVTKKFQEAVLMLENGYKFSYRIQEFLDPDKLSTYEIYPKSSRYILNVLHVIGSKAIALPEDQKKNRKTKVYTVKLTKKQQAQLDELKSLCK
ncbi:MAG: hypothetical protein J6K52_01875 [Clostridia bacterium]|nr:hypothetical protein [Clostridia bacterium]